MGAGLELSFCSFLIEIVHNLPNYEESDQISMIYEHLNTLVFRTFLNFIGISFGQDRKNVIDILYKSDHFCDIENVIKLVG